MLSMAKPPIPTTYSGSQYVSIGACVCNPHISKAASKIKCPRRFCKEGPGSPEHVDGWMLLRAIIGHRSVHKEPICRQHAAHRLDTTWGVELRMLWKQTLKRKAQQWSWQGFIAGELLQKLQQECDKAPDVGGGHSRHCAEIRLCSLGRPSRPILHGPPPQPPASMQKRSDWTHVIGHAFHKIVRFRFRSWQCRHSCRSGSDKWMSLEFMEQKTVSPSQSPPDSTEPLNSANDGVVGHGPEVLKVQVHVPFTQACGKQFWIVLLEIFKQQQQQSQQQSPPRPPSPQRKILQQQQQQQKKQQQQQQQTNFCFEGAACGRFCKSCISPICIPYSFEGFAMAAPVATGLLPNWPVILEYLEKNHATKRNQKQ